MSLARFLTRPPFDPAVLVFALLGLGYLFLAFEVFVLTGTGAVGAGGVLCLAAACAYSLRQTIGVSRARTQPTTETNRSSLLVSTAIAFLTGGLFFAIGYGALNVGHPAEDAYILFRYAEHVATGHGIVFNVGGPRAEGATDFLWLLLVSGLTAAGLDVAISALVLNGLGAGLTALLLTQVLLSGSGPTLPYRLGVLVVPFWVVLFHGAAAAYGGFSAMLYSSLVALLYWVATTQRERGVFWLPVVGLVVALFRPDGVVIGVCFALLGLWPAGRRRLGRYLAVLFLSGVGGLVYFAWRYAYFGLSLPLPLYVKSRPAVLSLGGLFAQLPGLEGTLAWLESRASPLPTLALVVVLAIGLRVVEELQVKRVIVFLLPVGLLAVGFLFGQLTQNVGLRFQAPISLVLFFALVQLSVMAVRHSQRQYQRVALLALLMPVAFIPLSTGIQATVRAVQGPPTPGYMDTFTPMFGAHVDAEVVVALTEAGRLPYWHEGRAEDMIGLNNPHTALVPPSTAYLEAMDADVVFFDHVDALDLEQLEGHNSGRFTRSLSVEELAAAVRPRFRSIFENGLESYEESLIPVMQSVPVILTRYLVDNGGYDIVAVDRVRNGTYRHVYGFRKGWPCTRSVVEMINATGHYEPYRSYLAIKGGMPEIEKCVQR